MPAEHALDPWKASATGLALLTIGSVLLVATVPGGSARGPVRADEIARVLPLAAAPIATVLALYRRSITAAAQPVGWSRSRRILGMRAALVLLLLVVLASTLWVSGAPLVGAGSSVGGALILAAYLAQQRLHRQLRVPGTHAALALTPGFLPAGVVALALVALAGIATGEPATFSAALLGVAAVALYMSYGSALAVLAGHRRVVAIVAWLFLGVLVTLLYASQFAPNLLGWFSPRAALIGGVLLSATFLGVERERRRALPGASGSGS